MYGKLSRYPLNFLEAKLDFKEQSILLAGQFFGESKLLSPIYILPIPGYVATISKEYICLLKVIAKEHLNFHWYESANALHTRASILTTWQSWEQTAVRQVIACGRKLLADPFSAEGEKMAQQIYQSNFSYFC